MSSEIIGELGQVGLTVSEVPTTECRDLTSTNDVKGKKRNAKLSPNYRIKRFRSEWMLCDIFKDWLRPHSCPEFAVCTACNRVIKAGKSELEKHATGIKHLKMLKRNNNTDSQNLVLVSHQEATSVGENYTESSFVVNLAENGSGSQETGFSISREIEPTFNEVPQFQYKTPLNQEEPITHTSKAAVTHTAPHWNACAIVNGHVTTLDLNDYKGRYLLMIFYPHDFCKISATEINGVNEISSELRSLGVEAVACSVDSHLSHLTWSKMPKQDGGIAGTKIALLSDPTHSIAKDYGVYLSEKGHTLRAQFVIDKRGVIRHMSVNDVATGIGTAEVLRIIKAIQFNDETEEGCPADWKPPVD